MLYIIYVWPKTNILPHLANVRWPDKIYRPKFFFTGHETLFAKTGSYYYYNN